MKILFIRPLNIENINTRLPESLNRRQGIVPPLGLAYIASTLEKAGHNVKILDTIALNLSSVEIRNYMCEFQPDIVGITVMSATLFGALEFARMAKEVRAITIMGGPHLSIYPKETLDYPYLDYGINGEGEFAMLELLNALEGKKDLASIRGLIYKKNNEVYVNEPVIVEDIDSLPFPAYHLLPMNKYDSIISLYPVSTMISSRGCPYQCNFCFKQPSDKKIRFRSPRNVVDEMEYLVKKYKIREIMFYDDVFTLHRPHVVGICEEILTRNLHVKWETPTRVNHLDGELLKLMRRSGCIRLRYGIESGNETVLKMMNKKIDLRQTKEAFKWTRTAGIEIFAYFMIGYAYETETTVKQTINFAIELNPDLAMFTVVTPYPGTPLYDFARKEKIIDIDYWHEFSSGQIRYQRIPYFIPDAEKWLKHAYRKFYFRPTYILKRLNKVRSLRDFKKCLQAFQGISKFEME